MDGSNPDFAQIQEQPNPSPVFEYDAHRNHFKYAWNDLKTGLARYRLVLTMVNTEFKSRYKGTLLGAFWLTATAAVTVIGLGVIYSKVFQIDFQSYLPYVAIGMMVWGLIAGFVNDSVNTFSGSASVFTQINIPMSVFPMRLTGRLMLTFFYRALVVVAILVFFRGEVSVWQIGASLLGLVMTAWVGFWIALLFGILGARFRDFGQFIGAFMTFAFFMTPVFWEASRLGSYNFVVDFNPLYHFLNIVRGPLIGGAGLPLSFAVAAGLCVVVPAIALASFARFRHRLAYWC